MGCTSTASEARSSDQPRTINQRSTTPECSEVACSAGCVGWVVSLEAALAALVTNPHGIEQLVAVNGSGDQHQPDREQVLATADGMVGHPEPRQLARGPGVPLAVLRAAPVASRPSGRCRRHGRVHHASDGCRRTPVGAAPSCPSPQAERPGFGAVEEIGLTALWDGCSINPTHGHGDRAEVGGRRAGPDGSISGARCEEAGVSSSAGTDPRRTRPGVVGLFRYAFRLAPAVAVASMAVAVLAAVLAVVQPLLLGQVVGRLPAAVSGDTVDSFVALLAFLSTVALAQV